MFAWLAGPEITRLVDNGRVLCPLRHTDIDVERCRACPNLGEVTYDDRGRLVEIVCHPDAEALAGHYYLG